MAQHDNTQPVQTGAHSGFTIRALQADDAAAFQVLRLQALHAHPHAFFTSHEEQAAMPLPAVAQGIAPSPTQFVLGAWVNEQLVGTMGLQRLRPQKRAHKAEVWGVYVDPAQRGQGIAQALLLTTLARARTISGLRQVQLGVASINHAAIALYQQHGFVRYGVEPQCLHIDGVDYDEDWMALAL